MSIDGKDFCLRMKYIWNLSYSNLDILDGGIWEFPADEIYMRFWTWTDVLVWYLEELGWVRWMWDEHDTLEVIRCLLLRWLRGSIGHMPKLFNALCMNEQFNFGFFRCTSKSLSTTHLAFSPEHVSWQLLSHVAIIGICIG